MLYALFTDIYIYIRCILHIYVLPTSDSQKNGAAHTLVSTGLSEVLLLMVILLACTDGLQWDKAGYSR